jgi:hypothetical protein
MPSGRPTSHRDSSLIIDAFLAASAPRLQEGLTELYPFLTLPSLLFALCL